MSKKVILICGKANSGKSKTIQTFFGRNEVISKWELVSKTFNGRLVFAVGDTSPQEQNDFCQVAAVKSDIKERLRLCEEKAGGKDFTLILPFTISRKAGRNDEPNTKCIEKPIEWLKETYEVKVIYLRKMDYADVLMRDLSNEEIQSVQDEELRQAGELKRIVVGF
jgi:hypothetical protein